MSKKRSNPLSLQSALFLLIAGLIVGTVFTIGMQFWSKDVNREECISVKTKITSYDIEHSSKRPADIKEIKVNCSDGKSYHIDGISINNKLIDDLSLLQNNTEISLLIHPNSNTLLEIKTSDRVYLEFSETIGKLQTEKTGFLFLGIFSYICAVIGFYYVVVNLKMMRKR